MEDKDTLIRQNRVRVDDSRSFGVGFIKVTPKDDEDLYQVWRLLSKDDYCEGETYRKTGKKDIRKVNIEMAIKKIDFDGFSALCVWGTVVSTPSSVRIGLSHKMNLERQKDLTLRKARWDALDLEFLRRAENAARANPMGVLLFHGAECQIFIIRESCTTLLRLSEIKGDERNYFRRVTQGLMSNIDVNSIDPIIIASEGNVQKNFLLYFFEHASKEKSKFAQENKSKFVILDIPLARQNLKTILLNEAITRKLRTDTRRPLLEVRKLMKFRSDVRKHPDRASTDEDRILLWHEQIVELLVSEQFLRDSPMRPQYAEIIRTLLANQREVTFFSPYHLWHADLMEMGGVGAIFDNHVGE